MLVAIYHCNPLFNSFIGRPVLVFHSRTRAIFDVAIKVHRNIQERDIEVGRNLGNFMLRWLDRMKPSAQIRRPPSLPPVNGGSTSSSSRESTAKHATGTSKHKPPGYSNRHLFTSLRPKPFPSISRMMSSPNPVGTSIHGRHLSIYTPEVVRPNHRVNWSEGVIRKDILQWMLRN